MKGGGGSPELPWHRAPSPTGQAAAAWLCPCICIGQPTAPTAMGARGHHVGRGLWGHICPARAVSRGFPQPGGPFWQDAPRDPLPRQPPQLRLALAAEVSGSRGKTWLGRDCVQHRAHWSPPPSHSCSCRPPQQTPAPALGLSRGERSPSLSAGSGAEMLSTP